MDTSLWADGRDTAVRVGPQPHPVVVAVDGSAHSIDALDWAAAEAAEQDAELRIVHAFEPIWFGDPYTPLNRLEAVAIQMAEAVLRDAVARVHEELPALRVSTRLRQGSPASAILHAAPRHALVVLGRPDVFSTGQTVDKVLQRARGPVVVVSLSDDPEPERSVGQVVVACDRTRAAGTVVNVAFREARRRGVGLTVLLPNRVAIKRFDRWRESHPDVAVRREFVIDELPVRLLEQSHAATLLVLAQERRRPRHLWRRRPRPWLSMVLRGAASPVLLVRTSSEAHSLHHPSPRHPGDEA